MKQNSVEITKQIQFLNLHQVHPCSGDSLWKCDLGNGRTSVESATLGSFIYNDGERSEDYPVIQRLIGAGSLAEYETVNNIIGFEESEYVQLADLNVLSKYLDVLPLTDYLKQNNISRKYVMPWLFKLLVKAHNSSSFYVGSANFAAMLTLNALVRSWSRHNNIYVLDCTYADYLSQEKP